MPVYVDDDEQLSAAVVRAVGTHENTEIRELPSLYDVIDPDALNTLCSAEARRFRGTISFSYSDSYVEIHSHDAVSISILDQ